MTAPTLDLDSARQVLADIRATATDFARAVTEAEAGRVTAAEWAMCLTDLLVDITPIYRAVRAMRHEAHRDSITAAVTVHP